MKGQEKYVLVYKKLARYRSKLKSIGFRATSLSTYDFFDSVYHITHNLIKEKLPHLIERTFKKTFKRKGMIDLACNDKKAFFTSRGYKLWSCQNVCDALSYLLDDIYISWTLRGLTNGFLKLWLAVLVF